MSIKFVQYFVEGDDKNYRKLAELSKEINSKYCQLHNYKYQFDDWKKEVVVDQFGEFNWGLAAGGIKIKYLRDQLNKQDCDYLVFVDADAAVSFPQLKIEDMIDQQHQLFLSRGNNIADQISFLTNAYKRMHNILYNEDICNQFLDQGLIQKYDLFKYCESFSTNYILFNEGLFIIKNTERMREFFEQAYKFMKSYIIEMAYDSFSAIDGRTIRYMLMLKKWKDIYIHLYPQSQGCVIGAYKMKYDLNKTFILHNYGSIFTIEQRIAYLEQLKQNFWWKQVYDWSI